VMSGAEQGALASRIAAMLVVMYGEMGMPGSCSYRQLSRGPEPLIYTNPAPPSLGSSSSSSLRSGAHIHLFSFAVSLFSAPHRRSHCNDGHPLLPTALWEVQSTSSQRAAPYQQIPDPILEQSDLETIIYPQSEQTCRLCFTASRYLLGYVVDRLSYVFRG
jgi:hypothetical protein